MRLLFGPHGTSVMQMPFITATLAGCEGQQVDEAPSEDSAL
jgi:hypothetical protein